MDQKREPGARVPPPPENRVRTHFSLALTFRAQDDDRGTSGIHLVQIEAPRSRPLRLLGPSDLVRVVDAFARVPFVVVIVDAVILLLVVVVNCAAAPADGGGAVGHVRGGPEDPPSVVAGVVQQFRKVRGRVYRHEFESAGAGGAAHVPERESGCIRVEDENV